MLPIATFLGYAFGYLLDKSFRHALDLYSRPVDRHRRGVLQLIRHFLQDTRDE